MENELEKEIKEVKLKLVKDYILELTRRITSAELDIGTLEKMEKNEIVGEKPSTVLKGVNEKISAEERINELKEALERNKTALEVARAKYEELKQK